MDGSRRDSGRSKGRNKRPKLHVGSTASAAGIQLRSFEVGAVPILNHYFERLRLDQLLDEHLPADDSRCLIATRRIVLLLVRNVLLSREPMYAVPKWVARHAPDLFDLYHVDIDSLQDDRLGGCLARLFSATTPQLLVAIVGTAIDVFDVSVNEMHNDSTSATFHGLYRTAQRPVVKKGRVQPAITWGHNKDHRPDLKQLLFTLTLANDGGVPLYFHVDDGNTTDDLTHRRSWDLLAELAGTPDFLYVADCKLASRENLHHIAARGGRFVTVLPATRREDTEFRQRLRDQPPRVTWQPCWTRVEEPDDPCCQRKTTPDDVFRVCEQEESTSDGYRLLWYHSSRKAELDQAARGQRCQRAIQELQELHDRLWTTPCKRYSRGEASSLCCVWRSPRRRKKRFAKWVVDVPVRTRTTGGTSGSASH